ncbi:tyrosine-type recombinase/integrase [Bradyrhizobium sp. Pear77]|uniref:tyrosine-type recombinase/integrase n=1 Tax=Bradyrhizobium altum TaxID=1571202 RepID=UPI00289C5AB7|nr:tyrosine-type recombinase/integrase [Bradyrhizobium altum]MCC8956190.1 tyrosine-type recombinase/integrase [Bradyrhizobium altum]
MILRFKRVLPKHCGYFVDSRGKQRLRFRKGARTVYPKSQPGSAEFLAEYQAFLNETVTLRPTASKGSVSALITQYYESADFKVLSQSTRTNYRRFFERFRTQYGSLQVASLQTKHVNAMIDAIADKPAAAKHFRLRLKALMEFGVGAGFREDNPVDKAKKVKHKDKGIRPWTETDIDDFRKHWPEGSSQRIAFEFMLHTGLRRSDVVRLGQQHVRHFDEGTRFVIKTVKSQHTVELAIPIHPKLQDIIADLPKDHLTFITTEFGASRSEKAFTNWIREAAHAAGLPSNSSPHGLRKAACRRLVDAGCDPFQVQAITGHKNLDEIMVYVRDRDRKLLAGQAMANYANKFE